jgi:hypothetical protein
MKWLDRVNLRCSLSVYTFKPRSHKIVSARRNIPDWRQWMMAFSWSLNGRSLVKKPAEWDVRSEQNSSLKSAEKGIRMR